MSKLLKGNAYFLHLMSDKSTSKIQVKALLQTISKDQLNALTEIAFNILKGNIPLTENQKKKLRQHRPSLRILGVKKNSANRRKAVLKPFLVVTVLKIVSPVLKSLL
jgi:hypothetical protein